MTQQPGHDQTASMMQPDYDRCIVNLAATLAQASGGTQQGYPPLAELREYDFSDRPLILLIIDGLGDTYLQKYPDSFLCRHRKGKLCSVFPPTTATAVTSFFTGVAPQQHAITGWYTYFRELGAVATVLPFIPRYGGPSISEAGISPNDLIAHGSLLDSLDLPVHVIMPDFLVDSVYSRALSGRALRHGFANMAEMFFCLEKLAAGSRNSFITAYWPNLDSIAHAHGMKSPEAEAHFLELDRLCSSTLALLAGRGEAAVVVTGDHGLIDTSEEYAVYMDNHPYLASLLTLPLCGEPRCAYCYVRSDSREEFEGYVEENLGHACVLRKSSDLIGAGYFGRGFPTPLLRERVGEYVMLMKNSYIVRDHTLKEKKHRHKGVHGGLTAEEMHVPLIIL